MDKTEILHEIDTLMENPEQLFVLSTLTADGYPDSRIMGNICNKTVDEMFFTCQTGTRKIEELQHNEKASVYFTSGGVTVWMYGTATTTRDEETRKRIWDDRMLQIYEGPESPRLTVIELKLKRLRYRKGRDTYIEFDL